VLLYIVLTLYFMQLSFNKKSTCYLPASLKVSFFCLISNIYYAGDGCSGCWNRYVLQSRYNKYQSLVQLQFQWHKLHDNKITVKNYIYIFCNLFFLMIDWFIYFFNHFSSWFFFPSSFFISRWILRCGYSEDDTNRVRRCHLPHCGAQVITIILYWFDFDDLYDL
jgi:hypothetical protein